MNITTWLGEWLECTIRPTAKERTYTRYHEIVAQHLIPAFGRLELSELTQAALQKFTSDLSAHGNLRDGKGLSPNSVNSILAVMQNAMKTAYQMGYIPAYTADRVRRPRMEEKKIACFTAAEQKKLEQAALTDRRVKMRGIVLCLYTGLRIGELLALEWSDIDFAKGELTVSKSCHDSKKDGHYDRRIEPPKTKHSNRVIPLPKQLMPILREMKQKNPTGYVVGGEKIIPVRSYQASFALLLKKQNLPHRGFHALRHTFATRALECGMDVKTLSELLGHKNPTVTLNRYVHSLMPHKHEMMNRLGKLL